MMPVEVVLSCLEMQQGALVGVARHMEALTSGCRPKEMIAEHSIYIHMVGAWGEIAAAKQLGRYWLPTINAFKAPDIGENIQVRTRQRHSYELIIRDDDNPDHVYFLLTCEHPPVFIMHGWVIGRNARRDEWRRDHGGYGKPAWFVPQRALRTDGFGQREDAA